MFPKVPDQHKPGQPLIPNGYGIVYVLVTTIYLFAIYFADKIFSLGFDTVINGVSAALTLAICILFGGFMGLLDDWMDLKWRYKAFMPLIAALPLMYFALENPMVRTSISLPLLGTIQFGPLYVALIIPLIVMIVTNTVNMLGGFNGLETICSAIVLIGLMALSGPYVLLLTGPLIVWLILAGFNYTGKIFVGNSGSFAIGMTIASFAVIADVKSPMLISIIPYVFNSVLILLIVLITRKKAKIIFDGKKLYSEHRKSLVTLITYKRPMTEKRIVLIVSAIFVVFTVIAVIFGINPFLPR
jgi:UDP-N-acetylglucosamine--dolichyl-phosphate N-acetylglucosaminephosphotransferase